jgi:hypothetical protein
MEKETLKNIFNFLEKNDNIKAPFIWKLENNIPFSKEELNVKGNLSLYTSEITSLPEGLKIEGGLALIDCPNLMYLPEGLEVGGSLNLHRTKINSLPEGLKVGGDLYLAYSKITSLSLPEGLEVGGNLHFGKIKITSLPKGLKVGGFLDFRGTQLQEYTDDELEEMVKPGFIKGRIYR